MALAFGPGKGVLISGAGFMEFMIWGFGDSVILRLRDPHESQTHRITESRIRGSPHLSALPAGAGSAVFQDYPTRLEVTPNLIGAGKLTGTACGTPLRDEPLDFFDGNRRALVLRAAEREHAQHLV